VNLREQQKNSAPQDEIAYTEGMIATYDWIRKELWDIKTWADNYGEDVQIVTVMDGSLCKPGGKKH